MVLRVVAGPDVDWVDTQAFRKSVGGEGSAARVRAHQPDIAALGDYAVALPLSLHAAGIDDCGLIAADLFDIAGEELSRLVDGGVLVIADYDLARAFFRCEGHVAGRRGTGLHPRSAENARPRVLAKQ